MYWAVLFLFTIAAFFALPHSTGNLQVREAAVAVFTVTTNADSGAGSLRQAIIDANANAGTDTIQFQIGTGPMEISSTSALPDITQPVIIDGTTQPGFSGTPLIRLAGTNGGLKITGGGSTIRAIAVVNTNLGITLENAGGNIITGSFIGICPQSVVFPCGNLANGILINNSPNNRIGGSTTAERNNIGVNVTNGILVTGSASGGNVITGNLIGLLEDGTIRRNRETGVRIDGAPNNRIGGTTAGERNVISTNGSQSPFADVLITGAGATGNVVQGNYFGTRIDGTDFGLGAQNTFNGVRIEGAANNTIGGTVGTTPGGACTGACNLIARYQGNGNRSGVTISGSGATGNSVLGNFIGTNVAGTANLGNNVGVTITAGASNNTVGGTTALGRNLINNGIRLTAAAAMNTVQGNYIGTDTTGNTGIGVQFNTQIPAAVLIDAAPNNIIGTATGTTLGGACTGGCNLISGNTLGGVQITGAGSTGNRVDYNYIGLNAAGTTALRNSNSGGAITLQNGANNNTIGRPLTIPPFQETEVCSVNTPQDLRCLKDDVTGDWIQFDDDTGEYTWTHCRSGLTRSGVGRVVFGDEEIRLLTNDIQLFLQTSPGLNSVAFITPPAAFFLLPIRISDRNVSDSTCVCPTEGENVSLGRISISGTNTFSNIVNQILMGVLSNGVSNVANQGENIGIDQNASSNRIQSIGTSTNDVPAVEVPNGQGNDLEIFYATWLRFGGQVSGIQGQTNPGLGFDLNGNGIQDQNDNGDVDSGANNTQNYPVFSLRRETNGGVRSLGSFPCEQGATLRISLYGVNDFVRNGQAFESAQSLGLKFNVTESGGQCSTNRLFTGVDAFAITNQERISATATKVPATPIANPDTALVGVNGDTSEFSLPAAVPRPTFDFDDDGKTDISVWRPSDGTWHILQSGSASVRVQEWGLNGDKIVPADFDGDRRTDFAVFRPAEGNWYVLNSFSNTVSVAGWGLAADIPVPGDYNDDGNADFAVYRPSDRRWYIRDSQEQIQVREWGLDGDTPVPADYDGDGATDIAVFRPSEGRWYVILGSGQFRIEEWGLPGDLPLPADYSGDGSADLCVFRPSNNTWYRRHSENNSIQINTWGLAGDLPVPGDYDGDGRSDLAVWRPSDTTWYVNTTSSGIYTQPFGLAGDKPTPNAFVY